MEVAEMIKPVSRSLVRFRLNIFLNIIMLCLAAQTIGQAQPQPTPTPPSLRRDVAISAALMDPKNVSDIFGKRVSKRYICVQVTISNRNKDFQFLIHDVLMFVGDIYLDTSLKPRVKYAATSEDKLLVRGVAEKGQTYDRTNFILRLLRATGSIAATVTGIASVGVSYAPTVAMFNGPALTSYRDVFPDLTINQMNRLNDTAYSANTLVPKQSSKVLVAFLPQAVLMDSKLRDKFWNDPLSISSQIDFRNLETKVDGSFINELPESTPAVTSIAIPRGEMAKFMDAKPAVSGQIIGSDLVGSELSLDEPSGIKLTMNGSPQESRISFTLNADSPIPPGTQLHFTVARNGQTVSRVVDVAGGADAPTLSSLDKTEVQRGQTTNVLLSGTNFLSGDNNTRILVTPNDRVDGELPIHLVSEEVKSATSIMISMKIAGDAPAKEYEIRVITSAGISNPQRFKVPSSTVANR